MAFTAAQKAILSEIFGIDGETLDDHLDLVTGNLSPETETAIIADLDLWTANRSNFARFYPKESNKGFSLNPAEVRSAIKIRVANWLSYNTALFGSGIGRLARS